MNPASNENVLSPALLERVLAKLNFNHRPAPTLENLRAIYAAWCQRVSFDNVRKLIHKRAGDSGPFPGNTPEDFFEAWLRHGTGGTCWSGAGSFHAFLRSLGFKVARGIGTMLVVPDLPPNHGTVRVTFDQAHYLVDCSMLHGEPLRLDENSETRIKHPAWGVRCAQRDGRWHVWWRPLHKVEGFECRLERFDAEPSEFAAFYEKTRPWSPFNYELSVRINRGENVIGAGFGHGVSLLSDGSVTNTPISHEERMRLLIEDIGMSEEIVSQLPQDTPTPPPPGSKTAQAQAADL